jgi:hypothetical protein
VTLSGSLVTTGWIAAGPAGGDEAFLLVGSADPAVHPEAGMRDLAAVLGIEPSRVHAVDPSHARVTLDGMTLRLEYGAAVILRPVSVEWAQIARSTKRVVLVLALDLIPSQPTLADADAVTARPDRTLVALLSAEGV